MKRGSLFLVALLSAGIAFDSLAAFVGIKNSGWNHYNQDGWHHRHCNYEQDKNSSNNQ